MKFIVQDTFSIKKVLIFGGFGLCRFQHKVGMNSFPMRMNVISYGTNSFPWGMYSFRSKIPIVPGHTPGIRHCQEDNRVRWHIVKKVTVSQSKYVETTPGDLDI